MIYRTVTLDPPWQERGGGKSKRGADRHYPLLSTMDCARVVLESGRWNIADNAHCYLWVTNNFLQDGLYMVEELGFRPVTNLVWIKDKFGIGQYFRGQHELCIFGVRGRGMAPEVFTGRRDIPTVIEAPRRRHSQKPEEFYSIVEARSKGPYCEFFARTTRPGWHCWGNEV